MSERSTYQCVYCGKNTTLRCSGCSSIYICSRDCQKLIWKQHKDVCKKIDGTTNPDTTKNKKKDMSKGFLNTDSATKFAGKFEAGGKELMFCLPCEEEGGESKETPFRVDGALIIETIPGASYTDMEFTMLKHVKDMVKSIQKGDLNSTGMVANHFLSGEFKQLCDKAYFQAKLFPGFSSDALESLPQSMRELLLWKNLTVDLTKIARHAAKVLTSVQQKGAARGDVMDRQTQTVLSPQIAQEALAVELEAAVRKLGKQVSRVAAQVQASIADPEAEQASWDQLDEDIWPELSGPSKLCYQEEFLGEEWTALIAADCGRFARDEKMDDVPLVDGRKENETDVSSVFSGVVEVNAPHVPARIAWLTDAMLEHYPALMEAVIKLRALPFELNRKQGSIMELLEPVKGHVALTHYRPFSKQQRHFDNSIEGTDSGIRLSCNYHLVPGGGAGIGTENGGNEGTRFYHSPRVEEGAIGTPCSFRVEDDGLAIFQSTEVMHWRAPASQEYFVLSSYILGKK